MPSWEELMTEVQPHYDENGAPVPGTGLVIKEIGY